MLHDLFPNWPRSKAHRCKEVASCTNHWPGMILPNICMSQDMFCIFMWLSVETCINHKNSSSNLDLKTCFLRIYISFSFVSYRQSMCLFVCFFFFIIEGCVFWVGIIIPWVDKMGDWYGDFQNGWKDVWV